MQQRIGIALALCAFCMEPTFSQDAVIGVHPEQPNVEDEVSPNTSEPNVFLPDDLRVIREGQSDLAAEQGVDIRKSDEGMRSVSSIVGVPKNISNEVVANKDDMISIIDILYPHFGFQGTEVLKLNGQAGNTYHFQEYINNIPTQYVISVHVDQESSQILRIMGVAAIDRGFGRDPAISEQEAIQSVMDYLSDRNAADQDDLRTVSNTSLYYKPWGEEMALVPWWLVTMDRTGSYFVDPEGGVSSDLVVTH